MHRHRLVALTNPAHFNRSSVTITGASDTGKLVSTVVRPAALAQALTNTTFCDISDMCEMFGCDLPTLMPFGPRLHFSAAWQHKLVIDSDGWGPSGRWRALMESSSLPLRSSVYREWFVPLMVPWVHYVPVSVGLAELWAILGYFIGAPAGAGPNGEPMVAHDDEARQIAEAGQKWTAEHFRRCVHPLPNWRPAIAIDAIAGST